MIFTITLLILGNFLSYFLAVLHTSQALESDSLISPLIVALILASDIAAVICVRTFTKKKGD